MKFIWDNSPLANEEHTVRMGKKIVGISRKGRRPDILQLEREDLVALLDLKDETVRLHYMLDLLRALR